MKWVAGAVLLLVIAWRFELGLLTFAAYAVLGLIVAGRVWSAAWIRQLTADRAGTITSGEIGDHLHITVTVRNRGPWRIPWLLLEDSAPLADLNAQPPALQIKGARIAIAQLAREGSQTIEYQVHCRRRGYYQFGPLLAETGDLFGLHRTFRLLTEPHFVMIYPKVLPLDSYDIESPRPVGEVRLAHRLFEDPTRISGVRGYQHGDPINRIHWRASARTGVLQSKTFESSSVAGATIVLDFHEDDFSPQSRFYCAELAVTLAATLAQALSYLGQQVGLASNGRDAVERMKFQGWDLSFRTRDFTQRAARVQRDNRRLSPVLVETRRDTTQYQRILETLARLELTREFSFAEFLVEAAPRLPRSASVVAILGRVTDQAAAVLGNLRRRGYSVLALVVTFGEPEHPDWAAPPDWAARLLQEGIAFRALNSEAAVEAFCSECMIE